MSRNRSVKRWPLRLTASRLTLKRSCRARRPGGLADQQRVRSDHRLDDADLVVRGLLGAAGAVLAFQLEVRARDGALQRSRLALQQHDVVRLQHHVRAAAPRVCSSRTTAVTITSWSACLRSSLTVWPAISESSLTRASVT